MSAKERRGERKDRSKKLSSRTPYLGYYLVFTDTEETERNYLLGLYNAIPDKYRDKLLIKVCRCDTGELVERCKDIWLREPQYRIPWIVFDRDKVKDFDEIINNAKKNNISVAWSNPCIEIWFFAYFGEMPTIEESAKCCSKFKDKFKKATCSEYSKSDNEIYNKLVIYGDESRAIEIAEQRINDKKFENLPPSKMCPVTTLHRLVQEIKNKTDN